MSIEKNTLINDVPVEKKSNQYNAATPLVQQPPQQQAQTVVVVSETDDFIPACMGTACCGLIGLCFVGCMCDTPTGRVGAATGCIFYGALIFVAYIIILILFKTEDCEDDSAIGTMCDTVIAPSLGRIIANIVIGAVILVSAILLRIMYVKQLNRRRQHVQLV